MARNNELFVRADKLEDSGKLKAAFRLFLAGAKAGDIGCQVNVGNYYYDAKGIRRNREAALYWYKQAYQRGNSSAASNIGIMWRNEGSPRRALSWFKRAVKMGDDEANLEITRYYIKDEDSLRRALPHLRKVVKSNWVTEAGAEEAASLLKQVKNKLRRASYPSSQSAPQKHTKRRPMQKLAKNQKRDIAAVAAKRDIDIYFSDIGPVVEWSGAEVGKFFRSTKKPVIVNRKKSRTRRRKA
jgi:TPR repeat protein